MTRDVVCAHSYHAETPAALAELTPELRDIEATAILFFCSAQHDGIAINAAMKELAPSAEVIGCTTGGEFTDKAYSQGGVTVVALSGNKVRRCAAALAEYDQGIAVDEAVRTAAASLAARLSIDLRAINPDTWIGVVLNEGLKGNEEEVNSILGQVAPLLSFLGGSAGDNFELKETAVFYDGRVSKNGSVFLLMELAVPHVILKTSSFEPTETRLRIGRVQGRIIQEINGQPAAAAYAAIVGAKPEDLGAMVFAGNPLGVVIEGEPWVRSPIMALPDGTLLFGCKVLEGSELHLLRSTNRLVEDTRRALDEAAKRLGREPSVGILFNCAHRCMEIKVKDLEAPFREVISGFPVAGFHSYGESWLAHMNHTLIGLLLG
ncbi:MAG TPA: FIST N-terminal domain-containing protein [Polyangiaceae bacterium]